MYEKVLEELSKSGARYMVVGAVALGLQGYFRTTIDLDIIVDLDSDNLDKIIRTLTSLSYTPRIPVKAEELKDPEKRKFWYEEKNMKVFTFIDLKNPFNMVDILIYAPLSFEESFKKRKVVRISGIDVPVASVEDLLVLKKQASRQKDLGDIEALEKMLKGTKHDSRK